MKNLLKSSVSVVVLLSRFATIDPAHAGNIGSKKNPEEKESTVSPQKQQPKKSSHPALSQAPELYQKIAKYDDIFASFLLSRGIDPETTQNTALVCKKWHDTIKQAKTEFRKLLLTPDMNLKDLKRFLVDPSVFALSPHVLTSKFPYKQIYQNESQNENLSVEIIEHRNTALKTYAALTEIQIGLPENAMLNAAYHPSICEYFTHLNPLDFKTVALAAYLIQQNPSFQKILQGFLEQDPIKATQFPDLKEEPETHDRLKKHLMSLKLLTLSGNQETGQKLQDIEKAILTDQFQQLLIQRISISANDNPHIVDQSLWSPYMVNMGSNSLFENELNTLHNLLEWKTSALNNLAPFEEFGNYVGALNPQNDTTYLFDFYRKLYDLQYLQGHKNASPGYIDFLNYQFEMVKPEETAGHIH